MVQRTGSKLPVDRAWGADNGCFARPHLYRDDKYLRWLDRWPRERCLFATAPDILGNAIATIERSQPMLPRLRELGYPAALIGQDGLTPDMVPWSDIDALFLGGTTTWKLGDAAATLVAEARQRDKWCHMGRVNSQKRTLYAKLIGCQSVDGTRVAFGPAEGMRKIAAWQKQAAMQTVLDF